MRVRLLLLLLLLVAPQVGRAGPNSGGVLLLHAPAGLTYTSGGSFCGSSDVALCDSVRVSVLADTSQPCLFYVLAAFPDSAAPRLKAISIGLFYDPSELDIVGYGPCADFEIPDSGWPATSTGNGLSWTSVQTTRITEVCWAAAYLVSAAHPTTLELIPHPTQGGWFVDDASPPAEDQIQDYGTLGFGTAGYRPCPIGLLGGDSAGSEGEEELPPPDAPEDPDSVTCTFPMRGEITPGNLLIHQTATDTFFYDSGTVTIDWAPGDTFRVNGLALLPKPLTAPVQRSDAMLELMWGKVPFVQQLVESGLTLRDAARTFGDSLDALSTVWHSRWQAGLRSGVELDVLAHDVTEEISAHPFVDPTSGSYELAPPSPASGRIEGATVRYRFFGLSHETFRLSTAAPLPREPRFLSRSEACAKARGYLSVLASSTPSAIAISPGAGYIQGRRDRVLETFELNRRFYGRTR